MGLIQRLASGAAVAALACAAATTVYAQETTGSIRGQLQSADGRPIQGATVTILHTPSGTRAVTASGATGVFDARGLRPGGPYTVSVTAPGYEPKTLTGVQTVAGEPLRLNLNLDAAAIEELVVTASRDVERDNSASASTFGRQHIESVVSVNRDIRDVAKRNLLASSNTNAEAGGISIAGSNPRTNRITIDGSPAQDTFGLNVGGLPTFRGPVSLDAVEQLTVTAVPVDVENGDFQGGAIDIVLRSGTNRFRGSAFVNYLNDGMRGRRYRSTRVSSPISQKNYGAFLSGPIWKDKLFFAASYETYKTFEVVPTGPTGTPGFSNAIRGVTQATIDQVGAIFGRYASKYDIGSIPRTTPFKDKKYSLKVDWNINDDHRLSLTNRYALSERTSRPNLSQTVGGLNTNWYLSGEEDYAYVAELNSRWSDHLTTQLRVTYRDYERRQASIGGNEFAEVQICSAPTSGGTTTSCESSTAVPTAVIRFGPDEFRQANELAVNTTQVHFKAEYSLGQHLFKAGYQYANRDIYNLFVGRSDGVYYFDSLADFDAGRASRLQYRNAPTNNPQDAAAIFKYSIHSLFLQDTLDINDDLQVTTGFRYDFYKSNDKPIANPFFLARNGYSNTQTYDGLSIVMPRLSFKYQVKPWFKLGGGWGLFSGGLPDVLISNSFSNTGYATADVDIQRNADGSFRETNLSPLFTQAIGATALNVNRADPRFGYDIPTAVTGLLTPTAIAPNSEVLALTPGFKVPSVWKTYFNAQFDAPWDLRVTTDLVYTVQRDGLSFRDVKARPLVANGVQLRTPDGRLRYDGLTLTDAQRAALGLTAGNLPASVDLVGFNRGKAHGYVAAVGLEKSFRDGWLQGLDLSIGYAHQRMKESTSSTRFGTTSGSLYGSQVASLDPNSEDYGTSYEEVRDRVKLEATWRRKFYRDYESRFSLFAEARSGRPFSLAMGDPAGFVRTASFGTNRSGNLLYVPDFASDPNPNDLDVGLVTFADAATRDSFRALVEKFGLAPNSIVGKGKLRNPDVNQVDLQFSQELPAFFPGHKFRMVFDVQNVLNLISKKRGIVEEYGPSNSSSQGVLRAVDAACATRNAAGATVVAGAASLACDRYIYSNYNSTATTKTVNPVASLWTVQVSLRYEF